MVNVVPAVPEGHDPLVVPGRNEDPLANRAGQVLPSLIPGVSYITANVHCKSRNLPITDKHNYSTDLR